MRELAVYFNDTEAGILTEKYHGADYTFQYKEDYINSALPPISATLPKQSTAFNSEHLFSFFLIWFLKEPIDGLYAVR